MATLTDHEIVANEEGDLALILPPLDEQVTDTPTLLVVREAAKAYLNLGSDVSHELVGLNPEGLEKLCATETVLVVEVDDKDVVRSFDAVVGLYDESAEDALVAADELQ